MESSSTGDSLIFFGLLLLPFLLSFLIKKLSKGSIDSSLHLKSVEKSSSSFISSKQIWKAKFVSTKWMIHYQNTFASNNWHPNTSFAEAGVSWRVGRNLSSRSCTIDGLSWSGR